MDDIMRKEIDHLSTFNGSYVLLAAYITREIGGDIERACGITDRLMDDLDRRIQEALGSDEYDE